jgi:hypothetical protein
LDDMGRVQSKRFRCSMGVGRPVAWKLSTTLLSIEGGTASPLSGKTPRCLRNSRKVAYNNEASTAVQSNFGPLTCKSFIPGALLPRQVDVFPGKTRKPRNRASRWLGVDASLVVSLLRGWASRASASTECLRLRISCRTICSS